MARQHTPGPWKSINDFVYCGPEHNKQTIGYASNHRNEKHRAIEEDYANARLMAAAPDLLAALDYLLEQTVDMDLKHGIELTEGEREARTLALNAIAKAKGEK